MQTLKHFILKQQAINLYRNAVRASKGMLFYISPRPLLVLNLCSSTSVIPDPVTRKETISWIRTEFERNKYLTDEVRPFFVFGWSISSSLSGPHWREIKAWQARIEANASLVSLDCFVRRVHRIFSYVPSRPRRIRASQAKLRRMNICIAIW